MQKVTGFVRLALGLGLPLLLFACGQGPGAGPDSSASDYPNGPDQPWSYTRPADQVQTQSLTPGVNTLYYEPILAATNGYGPIEVDHSNGESKAGDGHTLTLNGKTYKRGFGVHANSEIRYSLKGTNGAQCVRFTSDVGVDDEVGNKGSVVFQVFLDGVKRYDSGKLTGASATKQIDLNVTGAQELRLVVTDAGDNRYYDHADWATPLLYCQTQQPQVKLTLASSELSIVETQTKALRATFSSNSENFRGPLDLRLEDITGSGFSLDLQTKQVNFLRA